MLVEVLIYATLASSILVPLISTLGYERSRAILAVSAAGVASFIAASLLTLAEGSVELYGGLVRHNTFTSIIMLGAGFSALIALATVGYEGYRWFSHPAFYSLLPLILFGVFYLAGAGNVLVVVAAWLLVSVATYVLVALPGDRDSRVAAIKYIYVGIVATLLVALWASIQIAVEETGALSSATIATGQPLIALALISALAAFGFKVGIVPFHWWLPSVYGKADGRVVAVVAGVAKLGFIALIARLLLEGFTGPPYTPTVLAVIAVLTMTYGNVAALTALDLQRLLAYSSIAHMGYIVVALYTLTLAEPGSLAYRAALAGIALQSVAYTLAKTPLFLLTSGAGRSLEAELRGLLARDKLSAVSAAILLASLLGIPPLAGFWGKLYMFLAVAGYSIPLLLVALVNSGVSSAYYIRALRNMTAQPTPETREVNVRYRVALLVGAIGTLAVGAVAPLVLGLF